jgi:lantibiotic modifying enzyme
MSASAALAIDLYDGSAGVALFLGQLAVVTDDAEIQRAARGAIVGSLRQLERSPVRPPRSPLSFFSGDLGVAYTAWRLGELFRSEEQIDGARSALERIRCAIAFPHLLDVIGGSAGAIPALLSMAKVPGLEGCRDLAITLGEELVRRVRWPDALPVPEGRAESEPAPAELLRSGLSHGASGIGLALFELYSATGHVDFRDAGRRAFEYEGTLFEPGRGNWADQQADPGRLRFQTAWCNGAPGIALARLRAATLDPERAPGYLASARVGIATTRAAIERNLASQSCDATLCHGLGGLIEILLIAGRALEEPSYREEALAAANALIDRHALSGDWPSGLASGGPNPSLMLGTAGVGYTWLRLHDPEGVPSILWLGT